MDTNNFFVLFGLPISFDIDKNNLKQGLLSLQKQYHPDQTGQDTKLASLINHAYDTLYHDDKRAAHLLSLSGIECNLNASINDWEFLDEMMEFRMALDDLQSSSEIQNLLDTINNQKVQYNTQFSQCYQAHDWQNAQNTAQKIQFLEKLATDVQHKLAQSLNTHTDDGDLYV
ncbi:MULTISPECIES: Fe-S protein assembly co-chaperone HscB [unclassified Moraxella]|uniref:Fe-S protein assembly co-chaperone HscB n=1 Tax=unclassified Moraxella TaxID=2685852 RepID=UPI00359DE245